MKGLKSPISLVPFVEELGFFMWSFLVVADPPLIYLSQILLCILSNKPKSFNEF